MNVEVVDCRPKVAHGDRDGDVLASRVERHRGVAEAGSRGRRRLLGSSQYSSKCLSERDGRGEGNDRESDDDRDTAHAFLLKRDQKTAKYSNPRLGLVG